MRDTNAPVGEGMVCVYEVYVYTNLCVCLCIVENMWFVHGECNSFDVCIYGLIYMCYICV